MQRSRVFPDTPIIVCSDDDIVIYAEPRHLKAKLYGPPDGLTIVRKEFDHVSDIFSLSLRGILLLAKEFHHELVERLNNQKTDN